jgi:peptidoglycan hydrolase-like protein with peptidoglycan-binding domain
MSMLMTVPDLSWSVAGDEKLETAARFDSSHVVQGAKGPHVQKVQLALVTLDNANLVTDGAYGLETAAAVHAYKQKRRIINTTYQKSADNVVVKMTVAAMDRELLAHEQTPAPRARIDAIAPRKPTAFLFDKPARIAPVRNPFGEQGQRRLFGPIARAHLDWRLHGGGKDFVEDDNIRRWLNEDDGIRKSHRPSGLRGRPSGEAI